MAIDSRDTWASLGSYNMSMATYSTYPKGLDDCACLYHNFADVADIKIGAPVKLGAGWKVASAEEELVTNSVVVALRKELLGAGQCGRIGHGSIIV